MRAKITCKMCRREGVSICGRDKCALVRRPYPPGAHGPTSRSRLTPYGIQLREKQKAKRVYGTTERQFRRYFDEAAKRKGDTGDMLVQMLETRLDNVVYRLGLAKTRSQARQLVAHGHLDVNGKKVDIPSFRVRPGMTVTAREKVLESPYWKGAIEATEKKELPSWLTREGKLGGKVLTAPEGGDLKGPFDPKLIVEFYSR